MSEAFENLRDSLKAELKEVLGEFVTGEKADIAEYVTVIVDATIVAMQMPNVEDREARLNELMGQTLLFTEIQRLRVVNAQWVVIDKVVNATVKAVVTVALAAL